MQVKTITVNLTELILSKYMEKFTSTVNGNSGDERSELDSKSLGIDLSKAKSQRKDEEILARHETFIPLEKQGGRRDLNENRSGS